MPLISETAFVAIDFESAGAVRGATDVPVQIGIAEMGCGADRRIREQRFFVSYLATNQPIRWSARKVHGIGPGDIAGAPVFQDLWPELRTRLSGRPVVAHGSATERRFLRPFPLHGFGPWIDTLKLSRKAHPDLASHSLGAIAAELGLVPSIDTLCPGRRWHDALYDAVASLVILRHLITTADLENAPLESIMG